jgi:hypothetical protein
MPRWPIARPDGVRCSRTSLLRRLMLWLSVTILRRSATPMRWRARATSASETLMMKRGSRRSGVGCCVTEMAHGVCDGDPRTTGERRADALGALAAGSDHLVCACGSDACPTAGVAPSSKLVVHDVAEQSAVDWATAAAPIEPRRCGEAACGADPRRRCVA